MVRGDEFPRKKNRLEREGPGENGGNPEFCDLSPGLGVGVGHLGGENESTWCHGNQESGASQEKSWVLQQG